MKVHRYLRKPWWNREKKFQWIVVNHFLYLLLVFNSSGNCRRGGEGEWPTFSKTLLIHCFGWKKVKFPSPRGVEGNTFAYPTTKTELALQSVCDCDEMSKPCRGRDVIMSHLYILRSSGRCNENLTLYPHTQGRVLNPSWVRDPFVSSRLSRWHHLLTRTRGRSDWIRRRRIPRRRASLRWFVIGSRQQGCNLCSYPRRNRLVLF